MPLDVEDVLEDTPNPINPSGKSVLLKDATRVFATEMPAVPYDNVSHPIDPLTSSPSTRSRPSEAIPWPLQVFDRFASNVPPLSIAH